MSWLTCLFLAATYQLTPGKTFSQLPPLKPGDVVEVEGNATYPAVLFRESGTKEQKITVRGRAVNGKRPVIAGGTNTVDIAGSHMVFEGLEITGGSARCVFHRADDITIRDTLIHDCPNHGLLGADRGSGSLLLEYSEFHHNGSGEMKHQVYMATDEIAYPRSVFRMQFCYLHDGNGGNTVKSRAERNELYYNWIEGSTYHELELIGVDPAEGVTEGQAREDSDVVGNVIRKLGRNAGFHAIRIGGDGTGQSAGRYRFVNNTILLGAGGTGVAFRLFDRIDSFEAHGNIIFRPGGGAIQAMRTVEVATPAPVIIGRGNWLPSGSGVPKEWTGTALGNDPTFASLATMDLRPGRGSSTVDVGVAMPAGASDRPFPSPLVTPLFEPAMRLLAVGGALPRPRDDRIDIGAFEFGEVRAPVADAGTAAPVDARTVPSPDALAPRPADGGVADALAITSAATVPSGGGGCQVGGTSGSNGLWVALLLLGYTWRRRRRRPG